MSFDQLQGLLTQGNPMMDLGLGLLSQSGPVVGAPAPSLGQAFGNAAQFVSQRDQQRFENNSIRGELAARKNQRDAMSQLPGLLSDPNATQDQVLGLLATGAPDAFAQGLMGQYFAQPEGRNISTGMEDFLFASGMSPDDEGFIEAYAEFAKVSESDAMTEINLLRARLEVEGILAEREEVAQARQSNASSISSSLVSLAQSNDALDDTFLSTGTYGADARRPIQAAWTAVVDGFGGDTSGLEAAQTHRDSFETEALALVNDLESQTGGGFGGVTNAAREALAGEKPSVENTSDANRIIIAKYMKEFLHSQDARGLEVAPSDREFMESYIESVNQITLSAPSSAPQTIDDLVRQYAD